MPATRIGIGTAMTLKQEVPGLSAALSSPVVPDPCLEFHTSATDVFKTSSGDRFCVQP